MAHFDDRIARLLPEQLELLKLLLAQEQIDLDQLDSYVAPRTPQETILAGIWVDVLGVERVGIHDNFFELGGDSVLGILIVAKAQQAGLHFTTHELFAHPTIAGLAELGLLDPLQSSSSELAAPQMAVDTASPSSAQLLAGISPQTLARIQAQTAPIEDIYPLTPLQEGMLFHTLGAPTAGAYVVQVSCCLHGELDIALFRQAWQAVVQRHAILRTAFTWENLERPLQIVLQHASITVDWQDWQHLPSESQTAALAAYLQQDRTRGFDLSQPPLMRVMLMQTAPSTHRCVWSHHHLLLDGWSQQLLLNEVFDCYAALRQGLPVALPPAQSYRSYIAWLQQQDIQQAESFWRNYLSGFANTTTPHFDKIAAGITPHPDRYANVRHEIAAATTSAIQAFARQQHLTINTLIQGAWALILRYYSGTNDIVFGATVAGRPATLQGIDQLIGLCINTLPVRVQGATDEAALPWLQRIQAEQTAARRYEYSSLIQIQKWSAIPRSQPLFENILVFENFPLQFALNRSGESLAISDVYATVDEQYPLIVEVIPMQALLLRIRYDTSRFAEAAMAQLLQHIETFLSAVMNQPLISLTELEMVFAAADTQQQSRIHQERKAARHQQLMQTKRKIIRTFDSPDDTLLPN